MNITEQSEASPLSVLDKAIILMQALKTQQMLELIGDVVPVNRAINSEYLCTIVELVFHTGMHAEDIKNLKWRDVDLKQERVHLDRCWRVFLRDAKYGITHYFGLGSHGAAILHKHSQVCRRTSPYVFPSWDKEATLDLEPPFEEAVRLANISNFSLEDLRAGAIRYITIRGGGYLPSNTDYYSPQLFDDQFINN